ncbi:MAG: hypothetical protein M3R24_32790 [Chloroflexota bacterium]|nr:hypothetical protein [Chloroflexota bacterium]
MTTVIFVHGTGVREPAYTSVFTAIKQELKNRRPNLSVEPCYWGEPYGAQLKKDGASIPLYDSTRGPAFVADNDYLITLWELLYQDPLFELRLLSHTSVAAFDFGPGRPPNQGLKSKVQGFVVSPLLMVKLNEAGISGVFTNALQTVSRSQPFLEALQSAPQALNSHKFAVARAIIAQAIALAEQQEIYSRAVTDATVRDELVTVIVNELGPSDRGIAGWSTKHLLGLAQGRIVSSYVQRRRGALTDITLPTSGDVVLYQGRGDDIRNYIRRRIIDIAQIDQEIVLLAHSLGGVACVDLLVMEPLPAVKLLVTVGSQAPYLYEINALHSLKWNEPLPPPPDFPPWLNIFDLRDPLSYVGASIFPNRVQDVLVDSKQPFPRAHSAYWTNNATWKAIVPRLP